MSIRLRAQPQTNPDTTVYTIVEVSPEFPGGLDSLRQFVMKQRQYPAEARKAHVKGFVHVAFIIERDGSITSTQLEQELAYGCDEEALRIVGKIPDWKPGSQSGRLLRVKYSLRIPFGVDYPKRNRR